MVLTLYKGMRECTVVILYLKVHLLSKGKDSPF